MVVKRGHMNVRCPWRLKEKKRGGLNGSGTEAEQEQVLPFVVEGQNHNGRRRVD